MSLDDLARRVFDDSESEAIGSGWWSGVVSAALGAAVLTAVLCLRYPEMLTTPAVRAALPLAAVRAAIQTALGCAFLLGLASASLRRRKVLGFTGMALCLAASLLGGAGVEVPNAVATRASLGLDWFLLNVLLLAFLFVPLERLFPRRTQSPFRPGWTTDVVHFFFSHLLVQLSTYLTLLPARTLFSWAVLPGLQRAVAAQPMLVQFAEIVLVADLAEYAVHRLFHRLPALWRIHQIHHSSTSLDWLAGSRLHPVDIVVTRGLTFVPLFVLGFAQTPLFAYLVFVSFHAVFIHANLSWNLRAIEGAFVTPRFHHWHHAAEVAAIDKNFAVHLPWIDRAFGTMYMPDAAWPSRYGIAGDPVPQGYGAQLCFPFTARR